MPKALALVFDRCLQPRPSDRYASAEDMATDLQRWSDGRTVSIRLRTPLLRFRRRLRANWPAAAVAALLSAAAVAIAWYFPFEKLHRSAEEAVLRQHSIAISPVIDLDNLTSDSALANRMRTSVRERFDSIGPACVELIDHREFRGANRAAP